MSKQDIQAGKDLLREKREPKLTRPYVPAKEFEDNKCLDCDFELSDGICWNCLAD